MEMSREDQVAALHAVRVEIAALFAKVQPALTPASIADNVDTLMRPFEARVAETPLPGL
jgi:hypothetical protein